MKYLDSLPTEIVLAGYASLFGQRDLSGDIVLTGAFSASLLSQSARKFPMLFAHETRRPIGVWDRIIEDKKGLFIRGRLLTGSRRADGIARLVLEGGISGLSIGYRTLRHCRKNNGRHLQEIDLFEISLVAFPMLRDARLSEVTPLTQPLINEEIMI